jgi:2-polyprenyl-3-methyl-5-hydroxy-6-metoxy-1,4-benzoquinol methylase
LADLKIPAPAALATASALLALLAISLVVASRWWSGLRAVARAALGSAIASVRSPRFVAALGFGGLSWLAEAVILRGLASAAGHPLTVAQALWALIVLNLGIAVPVVVANLVTFEASLALGLSRFDVPAGTALAIGLAHHLVQALSVVGLVVVREIAGTFPRHATSFLVREIDKSRAITHYHRLSDRYDRAVTRGPLRYLREREHQAVLRFARFDDRSKATVLDVGCGGGVFSLAAKRAGLHVSSVDLAPGMVQKIGGQVDEAWVGDVETLQLPRRYDIVICSGVLDFVLNPEVAFENLAALVAPGGRLVVNAPRSGPWGWIYRMEKAALGIRVNLFSRAWFERQSQRCRIRLRDTIRPLPTNEVVLFEHPGS